MSGFEQLFPGKLPRLVMFDLDGTLIDSVPDLAAAVDTMLLSLGRQPAGIDSVREWVGNGAPVSGAPRAWPVASIIRRWMTSKPSTRWKCSWMLTAPAMS